MGGGVNPFLAVGGGLSGNLHLYHFKGVAGGGIRNLLILLEAKFLRGRGAAELPKLKEPEHHGTSYHDHH
jgi:hypothetical protein